MERRRPGVQVRGTKKERTKGPGDLGNTKGKGKKARITYINIVEHSERIDAMGESV